MLNEDNKNDELLLFGSKKCSVCSSIRQKIEELVVPKFPNLKYQYIDTEKESEKAAIDGVFTIPVVIVKFEGKEYVRLVRNFSINELIEKIERPYRLMFDE